MSRDGTVLRETIVFFTVKPVLSIPHSKIRWLASVSSTFLVGIYFHEAIVVSNKCPIIGKKSWGHYTILLRIPWAAEQISL